MNETTKYVILLIVAAFLTVLIGCRKNDSDKKTVMVSIEPQKWILDKIVGDRIQVMAFLNGSSDPENFDPPLSTIKSASKSIAYMKIGYLPWEDMIVDRVKGGNGGMKVIRVADGIVPVIGTHNHSHSDEIDPHIWTSVKNAKIMAKNMYEAVIEIDKDNKDYYKQNFDCLLNELDSLDSKFEAALLVDKRDIVVYHPILSYLARDYGLNQIVIGSENKEFSISGLKDKLEKIHDNSSSLIIYQPNGEIDKINTLLGKPELKMIEINPMSYDWDYEMDKIVNALTLDKE